jgi:benzoyl-CoA reductase subunit C
VFDGAEQGGFGILKGVAFMKCCDGMIRLYDLWRAHLPDHRTYFLPLPKIRSQEAVEYFGAALRRFGRTLGEDHGREIDEGALWEAISTMNRLRSVVRELYRVRLRSPRSLPYTKLRLMIREVLSSSPADALTLASEALSEIENAPSEEALPEAPVLVTSSTLDQLELIKLIEDAGMTIVSDDHCSGIRHFDGTISEEGDPYINLAEHYLRRRPCTRMQVSPSHIAHLIDDVESSGARGVIHVGLKYCDQSGYQVPRLQDRLQRKGIPLLYIENDYSPSVSGQLKIRIEAFGEMLGEDF